MRLKLFILSLLFQVCFISMIQAQSKANQLDHNELAIIKQIDIGLKQATSLLEQSVNINSGTMNFSGVKEVGLLFKKELDGLGLATEWLDGKTFGRSGHLVASHISPLSQAPKILMIGHLDTVFAKQDDFKNYQLVDERYVKGPGITDMKGGDVIMIETLRALKSLGLLDNISLKIVMTGDEEKSGRPLSLSKKAIIDAAKWADIALGFEDGDGDINTAVTARRGSVGWTLNVTGKAAHSSQIFREDIGDGAIYEAARILNQFRIELSKKELLTVNPGIFLAGTRLQHDTKNNSGNAFGKNNVIAKTAKITGDIRALSVEQLAQSQLLMQQIVADNLAYTSAEIIFDDGYPPMAPTQGNAELLALYNQISLDLGYNPVTAVNPRRAGAADISFAANHVDMALDGMGLMGDGGHTKNEVADMDSFKKNIQKTALLIYRLSKDKYSN